MTLETKVTVKTCLEWKVGVIYTKPLYYGLQHEILHYLMSEYISGTVIACGM